MQLPIKRIAALAAIAVLGLAGLSVSRAAETDAHKILKSMSDYLASQKLIVLKFDTDIEVVTPELQKIQFTSSGQIQLSRPDKLRASRTGGYTDIELVFDGKTLSLLGKDENIFAQMESPGSVDQLIDRMRGELSTEMPGADLLLSRPYEELIADVIDAKHVGRGVIDGVECEHLAFRNADTDWQLWVEAGARPIPRKYVITSKAVAGAPQYTLRIKDWRTDAPVAPDTFTFTPPQGAKKVAATALSRMDEVPPGTLLGGKK